MNLKTLTIICLLAVSILSTGQTKTEINKSDLKGLKQGHWIKNHPNGNILYDGFFKDDHPVGEFKRYYNNKTLSSVLIYSSDGKEAVATIYHENGNLASKGKYIKQMKEGKWQFFSQYLNEYLIAEEDYKTNLRNGPSLKFYPDSTLAEKVEYKNDLREGECIQYYPNGAICLKSNYRIGKLQGKFEVWYDDGRIQFSGQYKNDARDGIWKIFNRDGTLKYNIEYNEGITKDNQMDIDESNYLDSLEKNKGKIPDPEKTVIK